MLRRRIPLLALILVAGCRHATTPAARMEPQVVLRPEGQPEVRVSVELARSPEELQRGLMFRQRLDPGRGMLFLFAAPQQQSFWMRNTYIPLDMIFIRADGRVLGVVENTEPLTETPRRVPGLSQFVLEVPAGFAARHRVAAGTPTEFVGVE